jgi:hypothetical protein
VNDSRSGARVGGIRNRRRGLIRDVLAKVVRGGIGNKEAVFFFGMFSRKLFEGEFEIVKEVVLWVCLLVVGLVGRVVEEVLGKEFGIGKG